MQLVECVPNFSEGRDPETIQAISDAITAVDGVTLLDVDPGADTNRTVVTFVGSPQAAVDAAYAAMRVAAERIDMTRHQGAHPRQGATDVCPFVPVAGVSMEECAELARELGRRAGEGLGIPIFLYENAASRPERRNLAAVREGEYESLEARLARPEWRPDFGPATFNPTAGATAVGAREFLIAYNVNLNTQDKKLATDIALDIRERGRVQRGADGEILRDGDGTALRVPGTLPSTKAVGWYIDEYKMAQISINLTDYHGTPLHDVFEECCRQAARRGLRVTGSEVVGLVPRQAMLRAGRYYLERQGRSTGVPESELVRIAIQSMGLSEVAPFDPEQKIIEYRVRGAAPLVAMRLDGFADELSTDSPAPGGGSVAAYLGALSGALSAMVCNLTIGRKGYEEAWDTLRPVADRAQELKDRCLTAVDDDTHAFNGVMAAMRGRAATDDEKAAKEARIQAATREAIRVPFSVLEHAAAAIDLARQVAAHGNTNSLSDAGVAALAARAAARGAYYNVLINLEGITDAAWAAEQLTAARAHLERAEALAAGVDRDIEHRLLPEQATSPS